MAPLSSADSLRERRDLLVRHPDRDSIHPRLKPWLSAVGVNLNLNPEPVNACKGLKPILEGDVSWKILGRNWTE
ncbi:MAG: hypothetical protein K8R45_14500 [Desulfobacterales bacterium]|nr:hypothetical protein [Desulfobacterales bacterium]